MIADDNSIARRTFLGRTAAGLGAFALGTLLNPRLLASETEKWRGVINPLHHGSDADGVAVYKVEPYVVAADVYSVSPHTGRGA